MTDLFLIKREKDDGTIVDIGENVFDEKLQKMLADFDPMLIEVGL